MEANRQERNVLIFDVGTQSARALLINNSGEILGKKQVQYDPAYFFLLFLQLILHSSSPCILSLSQRYSIILRTGPVPIPASIRQNNYH